MKTIKLTLAIVLICLISFGCRKVEKEMMVETGSISNIQITSVDISGSVIDLGEGATQHGHCYSKTPNPKLSGSITQLGTPSKGGFTSALTNLEPGTKYYVKAYLSLNENVVYGDEINFTTVAIVLSQITTSTVTSIETTTAKCGGNITADGGASVSARGVCWSKSQNPTTADNKTTDGTGTGTFTSSLSALTASTTYYVRAYATNSAGTSYGTEVSFTTATAVSVPVLTTNVITNITQTSASGGGNITIDGGASITARGVCWSTSENPTIADSKTSDGTGKGSFISNLGSLTVNTTYYVRAYATNSAGTSYGNQVSFTTLQNSVTVPTITTTAISNIAQTTATGGGNISNDGGASVTARGICWSTSQNPLITDGKTSDGTGTGAFISNITNLTVNTTYYVRAYATNSAGTAYGNQLSFKTQLQDDFVLTNIMTGLKIVERIKSGSLTISINQELMLSTNYQGCVRIGDFVVYSRTAQSIDRTGWSMESSTAFTGDRFPAGLQIKYAWKSDGTVYMGAVGNDNEVLATLVEGYWQNGFWNNSNTLFEASALQSEIMNLKSSSLLSGVNSIDELSTTTFYSQLNKTIFNRFSKPIHIIFSSVVLQDSPGSISLFEYGTWWCPLSGTGSGTAKRSFSMTFNNTSNAYLWAAAGNDNGNSSYVKLDGTIVAQMNKYWGNYYRRTAVYPTSVELGATNVWSSAAPTFRMAVVGDGITTSNLSQTPTGGLSNNKAPVINVIPVYGQ